MSKMSREEIIRGMQELVSIVKIHSKATDNNFASAELQEAEEAIDALQAEQEPVDVQKAKAIESFVGTMISAFESGFTQSNVLTLQQLHRIMQHHCKDGFNIDMPCITETWGEEIASACAAPPAVPEDAPAWLQAVENVIQRAYNSAYPVCCGKSSQQCCGSPEPGWSEYDEFIMSELCPVASALGSAITEKQTRTQLPDDANAAYAELASTRSDDR